MDERLRNLERRLEGGSLDDERAWFQELVRSGALERRIEALVEATDQWDIDTDLEHGIFEVLPLDEASEAEPIEQLRAALEAAEHTPIKSHCRTMDREEAQRYLTWRCHVAPAYGEVIQPHEEAKKMAAELLRLLPSWALLFTNLGEGWNFSSMSWSAGLTGHTMDDGIVAWCGPVAVVLWFWGED